MKCIYCHKTENEETFRGDEHVVPEFLGGTRNMLLKKIVCDTCNSKILSGLETSFKENSLEGIYSSMIRLKNNRTVRPRDDMTKYELSIKNTDLGFFKDMFPFIGKDGILYFKSQFHLKNKSNNKYEIFWAETLENPNKDIRERMKKYSKEEIKIYAMEGHSQEYLTSLLKKVGINFKEQKNYKISYKPIDANEKIFINWKTNMDKKLLRVPAKIAFNYLAFCAQKSGLLEFIYNEKFKEIKSFIIEGTVLTKLEDIIIVEKNQFIYPKQNGLFVQVLQLEENNGYIWGKITIFNQFSYRVRLGKYPFLVSSPEIFGTAVAIDPFKGGISRMYPLIDNKRAIISRLSSPMFSLFSR